MSLILPDYHDETDTMVGILVTTRTSRRVEPNTLESWARRSKRAGTTYGANSNLSLPTSCEVSLFTRPPRFDTDDSVPGETFSIVDLFLGMKRNNDDKIDETYHSFAYIPYRRSSDSKVLGFGCISFETTKSVVAARRLSTLADLVHATSLAKTTSGESHPHGLHESSTDEVE